MKKTVVYCRVSTREQVEYGYSIRDQEEKLINYCKVVLGIKEDRIVLLLEEGASAGSLNRPKMQELITEIKKRNVSRIIIHNLDRMFRNMKDFIEVLELFEKYKVELISLKEQIETQSAMGRFQVSFFVLMAEWERNTISERTLRGMDRSAKEGNYSKGGKPPFGYKKHNKKLVVKNPECEVVKEMYDRILNKTYNPFQLLHYLKRTYPNINKWSDSTVRKILTDRIYIGEFNNGRVTIQSHSPIIIEENDSDEVQSILKTRTSTRRHPYIADGLIKCHNCDHFLTVDSAYGKSGKLYKYYLCSKCGKRVSEKKVDEAIAEVIEDLKIFETKSSNLDLEAFKKLIVKSSFLTIN